MDSGKVIFRLYSVAENRMFQPMAQGIKNRRADGEVHICHPQGLQVVATPAWFQRLVHEITRTTALNDRIEIVLRNSHNSYD